MPTSAFFDVNKVRSCNLQLFFMNNNVFSSILNHPLFCLAWYTTKYKPFYDSKCINNRRIGRNLSETLERSRLWEIITRKAEEREEMWRIESGNVSEGGWTWGTPRRPWTKIEDTRRYISLNWWITKYISCGVCSSPWELREGHAIHTCINRCRITIYVLYRLANKSCPIVNIIVIPNKRY